MDYEIWRNVCHSVFDLSDNIKVNSLQLYPFTKLNEQEKVYIKGEEFFNKFIKSNAIFNEKGSFKFPRHYMQKPNGSFRNTYLVSPLIYLYLECIGYQISRDYERYENDIRCYYAGSMKDKDTYYKTSYNKFYADINESSKHYLYYSKYDVTNFFESIDINLLFKKINSKGTIVDLRTTLIYKRLLKSIGNNKFPIVENSSSLSYLATYIYLDSIDNKIEEELNRIDDISEFQIVRYVDDLYIFFNTLEQKKDIVFSKIKNRVINEYQSVGLSLNEDKTSLGDSKNVNEVLNAALYDHYVNDEDINIAGFFNEDSIRLFIKDLIDISPSHNHTKFREVLTDNFTLEDITYSPNEVLRYLVYYRKELFRDQSIINQLIILVESDYKILKYNTGLFVSMILNTKSERLIKLLLFKLFTNAKIDAFDISIGLHYLISRNFKHKDLRDKISKADLNIIKFINLYCRNNFLHVFNNKEQNLLINLLIKNEFNFNDDSKVWYIFFMYKYHMKNNDILEAFGYYKTYFDRMTSLLMFYREIANRKNKPHYSKHHDKNKTIADYRKLNEEYFVKNNIDVLLGKLYKLRNFNPINHATAQIVEDSMLNEDTIKNLIEDSEQLLVDSFKVRY